MKRATLLLAFLFPALVAAVPSHAKEIKIGLITPLSGDVKTYGESVRNSFVIAVEEANAKGGYLRRRVPFEMVVTNDNGLWGSSGNEIIKMTYTNDVWAILGTIDGANSHIAIRVALKAEVLMINSGDTDPTFIETNIP